jgi:hypothetical protein
MKSDINILPLQSHFKAAYFISENRHWHEGKTKSCHQRANTAT